MTPTLRPTDPHHPQVAELLALSDAYMGALYPSESNHLEPASALAAAGVLLLGAWRGEQLLGCGAVKCLRDGPRPPDAGCGAAAAPALAAPDAPLAADHQGEHYGEIKRVFVRESARGLGLSRRLMQGLHDHLRAQGIGLARLETGIHQPEALGLYRALGYRERPPFGAYAPDPLSLFMELRLARPQAGPDTA